jgi:GMP synthase PP-ATPase subunit
MSASAYALPGDFISAVRRDLLDLPSVDTIFYDLTSKPPGTIEWE